MGNTIQLAEVKTVLVKLIHHGFLSCYHPLLICFCGAFELHFWDLLLENQAYCSWRYGHFEKDNENVLKGVLNILSSEIVMLNICSLVSWLKRLSLLLLKYFRLDLTIMFKHIV